MEDDKASNIALRALESLFLDACHHKDLEKVQVSSNKINYQILAQGFETSCALGHIENVKFLSKLCYTCDNGMKLACLKGQIEVIQYLLLAPCGFMECSAIFDTATSTGNFAIVELFLKSPKNVWSRPYVLANGLFGACKRGQRDMALFLIKNGVKLYDQGLHGACYGGQLEMAKLMVSFGATEFNDALYYSCAHRQLQLAEFMIDQGANNWSSMLSVVLRAGNEQLDFFKMIYKKVGTQILVPYLENNTFSKESVLFLLEQGISQVYFYGLEGDYKSGIKTLFQEIYKFHQEITKVTSLLLLTELLRIVIDYSLV